MIDDRLSGADFVRAAACMTVMLHHIAQRVGRHAADLGAASLLRPLASPLVGGFGVAIFFTLSGFLLARPFWRALRDRSPMPSLRSYAVRRAARVLPGFWLALGMTFLLSFLIFGAELDGQLVLRLIAGLLAVANWHWVTFFPVEVNAPLWSISLEITSYVLLPLGFWPFFAAGAKDLLTWWTPMLWVGIIAVALVAHWLFTQFYVVDQTSRGWEYGLIGGAKTWMPFFNPFSFFAMFAIRALGAGIQVMLAARSQSLWFDLATIGALLWVAWRLLECSRGSAPPSFLGVPYDFPWFVLGIGALLTSSPSSRWVGRILDNPLSRYVARISFGIYVWHFVALELVGLYWSPGYAAQGVTDPTEFLVGAAMTIIITIAVAHFSFELVEGPIIRWARDVERSWKIVPSNAAIAD